MNNASLELGGDNWAAKDGNLLGYAVGDSSGKYVPNEFTFTRGSNLSATRVNEDGYIEKGYENLLLQSNSFLTSPWQLQNGAAITPNHSGYDGSNDAWYLYKNTGTTTQTIRQPIVSTGVQTFSFYAKAEELEWVRFLYTGSSNGRSHFHLAGDGATGTLINTISASIELIGNGWYKCSTTINATTDRVYIYPAIEDNSVSGSTGGIYIQDAMLNQGLAALPYIETTTASVGAGVLENEPRIDYSSGTASLLLEPQRTNEIKHSEYYTDFLNYGTGNSFFQQNVAVSPENVQNAYKIVLNSGRSSGGGAISTRMRQFTQGDIITFSIFFKADEFDEVFLGGYFGDENAVFNLRDGSVISQASNVIDAYSIPFENDWYRCVVTYTFQNAIGNNYLYTGFKVYAKSNGVSLTGDEVKGILAYGAQIEQASYPTSYIPTYGVNQTRLGDITDRGSNLAYTGDYTFFAEFELTEIDLYFLTNNTASGYSFMIRSDDTLIQFGRTIGTSANVVFTNTTDWQSLIGTTIKMAFYKSGTSFKLFINGTPYTPTTNTLTTGDEVLDWRYINVSSVANRQEQAYIKQLLEFQTALTDNECIELTTI